jgi:hypothetical protein
MPTPILPLARMARAPRRWSRLALALAGLAVALGVRRGDPVDCASAPAGRAVEVCEREFLERGDAPTGARLAEAERLAGNDAVAAAIANGLLVTPVRADALWVLGAIALDQDRLDAAVHALGAARDLHRVAGDLAAAARDDRALRRAERSRACTISP